MVASERDKNIIKDCVDRSVKEGNLYNKSIVIFGCTIFARDIRDALREQGLEINAILDNNEKKIGLTCLGVPVYLPEEYFKLNIHNTVVIVCSKYSREMMEQLNSLGCREAINIPVSESQKKDEDSLECLQHNFDCVKKGYQFYAQLKEKYPGKSSFFLCPYPGTGDIYMACIYLNAYLEKEHITQYVIVVSAKSCRNTALLFGIRNIELVTDDDMQLMLKAWEFLGSEKMMLKPLLYWGWRTKRYLYPDRFPQITFNEMFLYDVFNLPCGTIKKQPQIDSESSYAEDLFQELGLKPHKTVIMAPYASSFESEMTVEFWTDIARELNKNGWSVATNCYADKENPVPGTVPIWFPYAEAANVLAYAGGFIALRSGLCDIVSQANCKLIILYESGFGAVRYEYFSLYKMGLNMDVIEFVYEKKTENDIKKKIIEAME